MQEHCSEEIIIHKLKQYISEFKDSIYKCEEQLEIYTCHLHSLIQISHFGDLVIDLEVQSPQDWCDNCETIQLLLAEITIWGNYGKKLMLWQI